MFTFWQCSLMNTFSSVEEGISTGIKFDAIKFKFLETKLISINLPSIGKGG